MPNQTGTYDVAALLAARFQSAADFGFQRITEVLAQDLLNWNAQINDALGSIAQATTERQGITGSSTSVRGQLVDEYSAGHTKVEKPGSTVGFPLNRLAYPVGKTSRWFRKATVADMAILQNSVRVAHLRDIRMYMKQAIFISTNSTFVDINIDNVSLGVKAFLNGDGAPIPDSPQDGTAFDGSTHTHYLGSATLDNAAAQGLIDTVIEHSPDASVTIIINRADVAAWKALTEFTPAVSIKAVYRNTALDDVPVTSLARNVTSNMFLGEFNQADVWVKPWGVSGYAFCYDENGPVPLAYRLDTGGPQGLELVQEFMLNPLTTDFYEALFGFGVQSRENGACLDHGNASYTDPVIVG